MGRESQPGFTWVKLRIKIVIIIVLKPDAGVDPDHRLGGSTPSWPNVFLKKKIKATSISKWKKIKKRLMDFDPCFIPSQPSRRST